MDDYGIGNEVKLIVDGPWRVFIAWVPHPKTGNKFLGWQLSFGVEFIAWGIDADLQRASWLASMANSAAHDGAGHPPAAFKDLTNHCSPLRKELFDE